MPIIQCMRCGKCCLANMMAYITKDDIDAWKSAGRTDLIDSFESGPVWAGDRIISPVDGKDRGGCPFLTFNGKFCSCSIYEARPKVCRDFSPASSPLCPQWNVYEEESAKCNQGSDYP